MVVLDVVPTPAPHEAAHACARSGDAKEAQEGRGQKKVEIGRCAGAGSRVSQATPRRSWMLWESCEVPDAPHANEITTRARHEVLVRDVEVLAA